MKTIAKSKLNAQALRTKFKGRGAIEKGDIYKFYKAINPAIGESTVNWRIHRLLQTGVLSRIGRGEFSLGATKDYHPAINNKLKKIYAKLQKQFPYLKMCIWETSIINEFMVHQPGRFYILVEVEREAMDSVFYFLKENKYTVYINPSPEILSRYVSGEKEAVLVKPLISEAPLQQVSGVLTITIEKMLVDLFCEEEIFAAQQGEERKKIFIEAFQKYTINKSRMWRYAERRRKGNGFKTFLSKCLRVVGGKHLYK